MILLIASFNAPHVPLLPPLSYTNTQTAPHKPSRACTHPSQTTFQTRPAYTSVTAEMLSRSLSLQGPVERTVQP